MDGHMSSSIIPRARARAHNHVARTVMGLTRVIMIVIRELAMAVAVMIVVVLQRRVRMRRARAIRRRRAGAIIARAVVVQTAASRAAVVGA